MFVAAYGCCSRSNTRMLQTESSVKGTVLTKDIMYVSQNSSEKKEHCIEIGTPVRDAPPACACVICMA